MSKRRLNDNQNTTNVSNNIMQSSSSMPRAKRFNATTTFTSSK